MRVDTMRFVDKWAGMPICFFLTLFVKILNLFSKKVSTPNTKKTLLIELSEMGSAIIVDPAMQKLKQNGSELFFVIFKDNKKSLYLLNTVVKKNIFTINPDNIISLAIDIIKFTIWCRKQKITCVIDLELFSRVTAILSFLSFAKSKIGFATHFDEGCYRGDILTNKVRYNPHIHITYNFVSLINTALGLNKTPYPTYPITKQEIKLKKALINQENITKVKQKIFNIYGDFEDKKIILINPNASDLLPQRRWPQENFIKTIKELLKNKNNLIIITGAPKERVQAQEICNVINNKNCINSAGVFEFEELVPLYQISEFMLTNDSGPAHFSSVTKLKVLVIFGPETPNLYLPLSSSAKSIYLNLACSPCVSAYNHRKTNCTTRPCIMNITPKMVMDKINTILK